ncbi:MAG: carbon-nitrogen hydrolase family protein [Pseudomonadota bacterium]
MRIAALQGPPVTEGAPEALARLEDAAARAGAAGAALLVTPEMFLSGYAIGPERIRAAAEPADGPSWAGAAALAAQHGIAIVVGGPLLADGAVYNAARAYGPTGLLSAYEKAQLFGEVDRSQFSPGARTGVVFEHAGWVIGLGICYDIEFPEFARRLAHAGAEIAAIPTANMKPFTTVCTRLVPARSEENGLAIAYANYAGPEGPFDYCGLSVITGPDGEDLARASAEGEALLLADLDRQAVLETRRRVPYLADIRHDLYDLR